MPLSVKNPVAIDSHQGSYRFVPTGNKNLEPKKITNRGLRHIRHAMAGLGFSMGDTSWFCPISQARFIPTHMTTRVGQTFLEYVQDENYSTLRTISFTSPKKQVFGNTVMINAIEPRSLLEIQKILNSTVNTDVEKHLYSDDQDWKAMAATVTIGATSPVHRAFLEEYGTFLLECQGVTGSPY